MSLHTPKLLREQLPRLHNVPTAIIADCIDPKSDIRDIDYLVWSYLRLNSYLKGKKSNWFSISSLAEAMGKNWRTINNSLKRLSKAGYLEVEPHRRAAVRVLFN